MDLRILCETRTHVRRSAAAVALFMNRVVLFGGIPHEDDAELSETATPEQCSVQDFLHPPSAAQVAIQPPDQLRSVKRSKRMWDCSLASVRRMLRTADEEDEEDAGQQRQEDQQLSNPPAADGGDDQEENDDFPPIISHSPLFVWFEQEQQFRFLKTEHAINPWSRHGHFLLVDPFRPTCLRVIGGRHWHIGDAVPANDLVLEISSSSACCSASWREEPTPAGLPVLYSPAVCLNECGDNDASDEERVVAYVFGGMLPNRTLSSSMYSVSCLSVGSSSPSSSSSSKWRAQRIGSPGIGLRPPAQFKGSIALYKPKQSIFVFAGFSGSVNDPSDVYELHLATSTWTRVCMSSPIARCVALHPPRGRFVCFVGGQRTVPPVKRVNTFVVFDLETRQWLGRQRRHLSVARDVLLHDLSPRSALCGLVLPSATTGAAARCLLIGGSEERLGPDPGLRVAVDLDNNALIQRLFDEGVAPPAAHDAGENNENLPAGATTVYTWKPDPRLGNGGEAIGSVVECELMLPSASIFGACAQFLSHQRDELLDDLF